MRRSVVRLVSIAVFTIVACGGAPATTLASRLTIRARPNPATAGDPVVISGRLGGSITRQPSSCSGTASRELLQSD
jgi:hypothetical protein